MSRRTVFDCDRCKSPVSNPCTLALTIDDRMDASGNGREYVTETIDLCGKCASLALAYAFRDEDYKRAKSLVAWVLSESKKFPEGMRP